MPSAKMCKNCKFCYISRTPYNYPTETRYYVRRCGLMYIIDPAIRLDKRLDAKETYCPLVKELIEPEEVPYDIMKDIMKEATLRMYRNGYPAVKHLDPSLLETVGAHEYLSKLYKYVKEKNKLEGEVSEL